MRSFLCSVGEKLVIEQPSGQTILTVLASETGVMRLRVEAEGEEPQELVIGTDRPIGMDAELLATAS